MPAAQQALLVAGLCCVAGLSHVWRRLHEARVRREQLEALIDMNAQSLQVQKQVSWAAVGADTHECAVTLITHECAVNPYYCAVILINVQGVAADQ